MKSQIALTILKFTLVTNLLGVSAATFAQADRFTGFNLEAATGYQEMAVKVQDVKLNNISIGRADQEQRITGVPFALNIGYSAVVSQTVGLGARFEYNPKSGRIALSIIPSWALTDNLQAYGKLGWAYMASTVEASMPGIAVSSQTAYLNGPLAGIGAKLLLTENVYLFAELTYYKYADLTLNAKSGPINISGRASSNAQNALVGLGFKF